MAMSRRQLFVILAAWFALVATANAANDLCPDSPEAGACDCSGADGSKQACKCLSSPSSLCKKHLPIICEHPSFTTPNGTNATTSPAPVKRFARALLQTVGDGDGDDPASTVAPASEATSGAVTVVSPSGPVTQPPPVPVTTSGGTELTTAEDEECHCDEKDYYCLSCRTYNMCTDFFSKSVGMSMMQSKPFAHVGRIALVLLMATFVSRHR